MLVKVENVQKKDLLNHIVVKPCDGEEIAANIVSVRMTDYEMQKFLCRLGLKGKTELIGRKMYLSKYQTPYGLVELEGEVEGDTEMSIDGIVTNISSKDGKCIWRITDGSSIITVTTEHEAVRGAEQAINCVFPWELQGRAAIFNKKKAYIMYKIG